MKDAFERALDVLFRGQPSTPTLRGLCGWCGVLPTMTLNLAHLFIFPVTTLNDGGSHFLLFSQGSALKGQVREKNPMI